MEQAGCAGGDAPGGPERVKAVEPTSDLRGACAVSLVSSRPGGVGAPPGDTMIPRQELANVDRWVLRRTDARPGMGRYRSPAARKLTHDPRRARPDAVNLPPDV